MCKQAHALSGPHSSCINPAAESPGVFWQDPQTYVRVAASLARVMAVDGAKHGVRGSKSLPATGLAMSTIPALVKRPRRNFFFEMY